MTEGRGEPTKIQINSKRPLELILLQIVEMRADITALSVLAMEAFAEAFDQPIEDVSARYAEARKESLLRLAFELQDDARQPPEQQD